MNPNNFPIQCFVCEPSLTLKGDQAYLSHMQSVHADFTSIQGMQQKQIIDQNIPKEIPLNKDALPSPEFMEVAKMIDKPIESQPNPILSSKPATTPLVILADVQGEKKPITLKYRYEGNCSVCNTPVRTIMAKANGKTIAIAYCLTHEQIEEKEVFPLDKSTEDKHITIQMEAEKRDLVDPFEEIAKRDIRLHKEWIDKQEIKKRILERRKETLKRKYDKRHKSKLGNKTTVSPTV